MFWSVWLNAVCWTAVFSSCQLSCLNMACCHLYGFSCIGWSARIPALVLRWSTGSSHFCLYCSEWSGYCHYLYSAKLWTACGSRWLLIIYSNRPLHIDTNLYCLFALCLNMSGHCGFRIQIPERQASNTSELQHFDCRHIVFAAGANVVPGSSKHQHWWQCPSLDLDTSFTFFYLQSMVVSFLPFNYFGIICKIHLSLLYSLYAFEYKWYNMGWELHKRLTYIEYNWPYFLGFGTLMTILTQVLSPTYIIRWVIRFVFTEIPDILIFV